MPVLSTLKNRLAIVGFFSSILLCYFSLCVGWPLRFVSKTKLWRAWLDIIKRSFGMLLVALIQLTSPAVAKVYSPHSNIVFRTDDDGNLTALLSPRAVITANHQIYSDWVFLWWFAYTADLHGAVIYALKRSLRNVPIFGWGMRAFRFLFLSRKWADDEVNISDTMQFIAHDRRWPVWLTLFPEGTVYNQSTWDHTAEYARKANVPERLMPKNLLLPRSKGLQACLQGLNGTVPVLYDLTLVYEPLHPKSEAAERFYSLGRTFLDGRGPCQVKLHLREFPVSTIPYNESDEVFTKWLYERWVEKDEIYRRLAAGELEPELRATANVRLVSWFQLYQIVNVPLMAYVLIRLVRKHLL